MGLPYVVFTESGVTEWQDVLRANNYEVQLAQDEIKRLEENGGRCEPVDHPRIASEYPYIISIDTIQLKCLEIKQHDKVASLSFFPKDQLERKLVEQVQVILLGSGVIQKK